MKYEYKKDLFEKAELTEPVYRQCHAEVCYCSGRCKEIIGYKNKKTNEITYIQKPDKWNFL